MQSSNSPSGASGILFGGTVSILRASPHPALFTTVAGIQWALLGSAFCGIRLAYLTTRVPSEVTPSTLTYASALAGTLSFASVGAVTRGRANILPGAVMGGLVGYSGQSVYNYYDKQHTASLAPNAPPESPILERIMNSRFFPLRKVSDDEYLGVLQEKLWKVKAEIAVLDDDLAKLRREESARAVGTEEKSAKVDAEREEERKKAKMREG